MILVHDKYDQYRAVVTKLLNEGKHVGQDMFNRSKEYQTTVDANGVELDYEAGLEEGQAHYMSMKAHNFSEK